MKVGFLVELALQGILSVAWNPEDATQLLTTGYDCRTLLWDVPEGEVRGELPLQAGAGTDVRWSPCHPNLLATATAAWDAQQEGSSDGQVPLPTEAASWVGACHEPGTTWILLLP